MKTGILLLLLMSFSLTSLFGTDYSMTGKGLEEILREAAEDKVTVDENIIEFELRNVLLICIYDENHDRMRIISPIKKYEEVSELEKDRMMESNFHSSLDARYGVSRGVLYSYIHPLSSLEKKDVLSGIYQVASLHLSFGSDYSSGILSFDGEQSEENETI